MIKGELIAKDESTRIFPTWLLSKKQYEEIEKQTNYTKKELDEMSLRIIKEGKDITYSFDGNKYILDIKKYEKMMRFERPDLFTDEK